MFWHNLIIPKYITHLVLMSRLLEQIYFHLLNYWQFSVHFYLLLWLILNIKQYKSKVSKYKHSISRIPPPFHPTIFIDRCSISKLWNKINNSKPFITLNMVETELESYFDHMVSVVCHSFCHLGQWYRWTPHTNSHNNLVMWSHNSNKNFL